MKHTWKSILHRAWIFFLVVSFLTGCQLQSAVVSPEDERVTTKENTGKYDFIFVCPLLDNSYWQACMEGIRRADAELGTSTLMTGAASADNFADEIVHLMADAVSQHPDGIIAYAGIEAMTPYIDQAAAEGVPVVTVDSDSLSDSRVAYVGTNLYTLGHKAGETLAMLTEGKAHIGYLCSYFTASNEMTVFDAFQDAIHDFDMEVVSTAEGGNDVERSAAVAEQLLTEHPDITAFFCTGGLNTTGAAKFVAESGLDIAVVGFEDTEENLDYVRAGVIDAILAQSPRDMGYLSVYVMKEYLDTGLLSSDTFNTTTTLITQSNVDTYNTTTFSPNQSLKKVRVGYYDGDTAFQSGFSDEGRKSGYAYEYYQAISVLAEWNYEYVYGSRAEIMDALRRGDVDIVAGVYRSDSNLDNFFFSTADMKLGEPKRYFAVNGERTDILTDLNSAISKLQEERPNFLPTLYSKYYRQYAGTYVLTDIERAYLSGFEELRLGYMRYNLPLCDQDADGNPTGLVKDLIEHLVSYLRVPIVPVAYDNAEKLDLALNTGEIDIAFPGYLDTWLSEQNGFRQTNALTSDRVMVVYSGSYSDDILDHIAANKTGIGQAIYLSIYYPQTELTFYENRTEVFEAIERGTERCTVGYSGILQRFLFDNPQYDDLRIAYLSATVELGLTVRNEHSYLVNILNKAIDRLGSAAINSATISYSGGEVKPSLAGYVRENSVTFVLILSAFFAVLGLMFLMYIRQAQRFKRNQLETNAALTRALEAAEMASRAKTHFLSSMSHDIRTPMNAIVGMTTVAAKYPDDNKRMLDCLEKINLSGQHLLTLINDVLDISKIESGKLTLNPVVFSLHESTRNMDVIFASAARDKRLNVTIDDSGLIHEFVNADEVRVNQVFVNLLSNAVKYTPEGGSVAVTVTESPLPQADRARFTYIVEDTGMGMSEEFMKNMYEMFSRAQDTRTNKIQGSGLGLTIVKQMIDLMHGTISCTSTVNVGTRFTVTLDLPIVESDQHAHSAEISAGSLAGKRLLIAEDNDLNWEVIFELLDMYDIRCERAENGQQCIDMLSSAPEGTYDLILMDVQMPVLNGKEATRRIRAAGNPIPIIAMTADAFAEDIADCLACGMDGHVAKPVDMDKLLQEMKKVLQRRHA